MIIPIAGEQEWDAALRHLSPWQPPPVPTVVIAPHPDDETLAAGGLIAGLSASGVAVSVIAITDGENAYEGETGLGQLREREQAQALHFLGVPEERIHRLGLTDSGLHLLETELADAIEPLLKSARHIVAPWPHDFHPDHEVAGRAALRMAQRHAIPLTYYFFWTWHRGTPALLQDLQLLRLPLTPGQQQSKREALVCHVTQLQHASGAPILPANLLEPAWRPYEIFLSA